MNRSTPPKGKGDFSKRSGVRVMDSIPPAITASAMPERMLAAASWTAIIPVAHWRCTAPPGVSGGRPEGVGHVARGAAAPLEDLAQDQVVDVVGLQSGRLDDARHRLHADVRHGEPGQGAAGAPDRRACGGDDDGVVGFGHVGVPPQARTKTGIVNSSEIGWNVTFRGMPTCSSSNGQSTTLVIMRGPSARSTMAAT